jgi:hypothetical protein
VIFAPLQEDRDQFASDAGVQNKHKPSLNFANLFKTICQAFVQNGFIMANISNALQSKSKHTKHVSAEFTRNSG